MSGDTYIVICRADRNADDSPGEYVLATRQVFLSPEDAGAYARTGADSREPLVIAGRFGGLRLPERPKFGTWPQHCEQRAFVDGAKWWEYTSAGATMWQSDQTKAEAEAVRRYGEPEDGKSWLPDLG